MRAGENTLNIAHSVQKFFAAREIELAHHVVENEHGSLARKRAEDLRFGELQRERRRARLPLRGVPARVRAVDENFNIVAVRSDGGEPQPQIALPRGGKLFQELFGDLSLLVGIPPVHIEGELFRAVGQIGVRVARKRRKLLQIPPAVAHDARREQRELFVPHGEGLQDERDVPLLQKVVPLIENALIARKRGAVLARRLRNGEVEKTPALVRSVLNEAQFPGRKEHAVHIPHEVRRPRKAVAVEVEFALVFKDRRFQRNAAEPRGRLGGNARARLAAADELTVVADPQRRARAKVKNRLGAVGLALRVAAREHVQPVRKTEGLRLVISEIGER